MPANVTQLSLIERQRDSVREIIILLFECRHAHHVDQCAWCEYWINIEKHHWDDCSCKAEVDYMESICAQLKSRLDLQHIGLPRSIINQIYPPSGKES